MALCRSSFADLVKETTTTTGTGNLTLLGAPTGYQTFATAFPTAATYFFYRIGASGSAEWEIGQGYLSGGALVRLTVLASTNSGALVSLSAGTKDVICTWPAYLATEVMPRGRVVAMAARAAMP